MFSAFSKTPISNVMKDQIIFSSPRSPGCDISFGTSFSNPVIETSNYVVDNYGSFLPVLVTEVLTLTERQRDISVKLEPFGYASLVCGRQLLIWKYKIDGDGNNVVHCFELNLPPSDLAHKADLVHLFLNENCKLPSALAVSPEGHVRYWPNINHEGSSVDALTDLQGQECYSLTSLFPLGCILATTTSSLVIITPIVKNGQPDLICRTLTLPLGVLAGIGQKVSSFIFGNVPTQTGEMKQLNRVLSLKYKDDSYVIYVLSSCTLQKWIIRNNSKENMDELVFEVDLDRQLKQMYADKVFKRDSCLLSNLKTWCLDMQLCLSGVMILTAGLISSGPEENIHYALGELNTSDQPQNFSAFYLTTYTDKYEETLEEKLLTYKFILSSSFAVIFNANKVLCGLINPRIELNEVNFKYSENTILGSGSCNNIPLFFTTSLGIVSITASQKSLESSKMLSIKEESFKQSETFASLGDFVSVLKKSMLTFASSGENTEMYEKMKDDILLRSCRNSELNDAVIKLSLEIIDDYPESDPRWHESLPAGSTSSLIIYYQLQDKLKVHECLMKFLKSFNLLEKLTSSTIGDVEIPTIVLLCEHAEKLVAAQSIRLFLNEHGNLIENAIKHSLEKRKIEIKNDLTPQDVFFREVSVFHTIFPSLIDLEEEELYDNENLSKILNAVMTVNKLFVGMLDAVMKFREKQKEIYGLDKFLLKGVYLPWTGREGDTGIRQYLQKQLSINLEYTLKLTDSIQIQGILYQQYVDILDLYLGSYRDFLNSLPKEKQGPCLKKYAKEKNTFIRPLLDVGQYERAAAIAEKYLDFSILVEICEETQNTDRLQQYMLQFAEHKFSEFVFKWYLEKGQRGKIFRKHLGQKEELENFLQAHDTLKWLYFIQEEQYEFAYYTLKNLALKETEFLNRKKTLLSLSKLVLLVSDMSEESKFNELKSINLEQDLITHQEALPLSTVEGFGLDPKNMRVFQPEELIEMYISDENSSINAYDFKIALDLLNFIKKPQSDPDVFNLRIHIWCRAILKDNWEELDTSNPLESIKETIFFQIIKLAFDQGVEIQDFMPDIDDLLQSSELTHLVSRPSFQFLIKAGFEHILKTIG